MLLTTCREWCEPRCQGAEITQMCTRCAQMNKICYIHTTECSRAISAPTQVSLTNVMLRESNQTRWSQCVIPFAPEHAQNRQTWRGRPWIRGCRRSRGGVSEGWYVRGCFGMWKMSSPPPAPALMRSNCQRPYAVYVRHTRWWFCAYTLWKQNGLKFVVGSAVHLCNTHFKNTHTHNKAKHWIDEFYGKWIIAQ